MSTEAQMPRYESHKQVWALKIMEVDIPNGVIAVEAPFAPIEPDRDWWSRFKPKNHAADGDEDLGYYVLYENNYKSWSPSEAFESGYLPLKGSGMSFGAALAELKRGKRVARYGWNGKGMFVFLVPGSTFEVNRPPLLGIYPEGTNIDYHAHIDMRTANGQIVPWLASQTDMLAGDWCVVGGEE